MELSDFPRFAISVNHFFPVKKVVGNRKKAIWTLVYEMANIGQADKSILFQIFLVGRKSPNKFFFFDKVATGFVSG